MRRALLAAVAIGALAVPVASSAAGTAVPGPQGLDARFGTCGLLTPPIGGHWGGAAERLARAPDGSIVAAGTRRADTGDVIVADSFVITRFSPAGQLDASFGNGGVVTTKIPRTKTAGEVDLTGAAVQPDGKIVASGFLKVDTFNSAHHFKALLARYNADGTLDASFGSGGLVQDALPAARGGIIEAIALAPDGGIIATGVRNDASENADPGNEQDRLVVARYRTDGSPDPAFGSGGVAAVDSGFGPSGGSALRVLADGRIVAGGHASEQFALVRLTPLGTLDPTFGNGGAAYESPPASAFITALALLPDGRIVVTGEGFNINGRHQVVLGRYSADGQPDAAFASGGFRIDARGSSPTALAVAADGDLVVTGSGAARGSYGSGLLRYGADGATDGSFGFDGVLAGFSSFGLVPNDVLLSDPDGTAYVAEDDGGTYAIARFAVAEPALSGTAGEPRACSVRVVTKSIAQLVRPGRGARHGKLSLSFELRQPGRVALRAVARVGARTAVIGSVTRQSYTFGKNVAVIPVAAKASKLLKGAKVAQITVSARGTEGGATTTGKRRLTR